MIVNVGQTETIAVQTGKQRSGFPFVAPYSSLRATTQYTNESEQRAGEAFALIALLGTNGGVAVAEEHNREPATTSVTRVLLPPRSR